MAESEKRERVVALQSELLSVAEVQRVTRLLEPGQQAAIDASALRRFSAPGLAALHELGRRLDGRCALLALPRALLREAIAARLARHFTLYASAEAYARRGEAATTPRRGDPLRAVIYEVSAARRSGTLDIAGRPLLVRQLQWLRDHGIEHVAVEIVDAPHSVELADLVLGDDPLTARCVAVPMREPLGPAALATRAGIPSDEIFLALPADTLVHGGFELPNQLCALGLAPPPFAQAFPSGELRLQTRGEIPSARVELSGWALAVSGAVVAHALSCAVLAEQTEGVLVHAAEVKPQIWLARGARVAEEATLVPPVLVGADARIFARARVGPNVIIGRHAVIDRDAVLSELSIAPFTWVGDGARIRQAEVDATGYTSFVDGARTEVRDPLLLATIAPRSTLVFTRIVAALLVLVLLLPWALCALLLLPFGRRPLAATTYREGKLLHGRLGVRALDRVPPLVDAVLGRRDLVGVSDEAALAGGLEGRPLRPGAIDITAALGAPSAETRACMVNWYAVHKGASLDRALWRSSLSGERNERSA